jgi:hypothetical protein
MPATANWRGLSNPFDPLEAIAIAESAKLLRDLRREFGNLGLAAAAYNAGSGRVRDWLAGRRELPAETRAYVRIVTGYSPQQWAGGSAGVGEMQSETPVPCRELAALAARLPSPESKPTPIWGVELVGGASPLSTRRQSPPTCCGSTVGTHAACAWSAMPRWATGTL